jgi:hypothetical protein
MAKIAPEMFRFIGISRLVRDPHVSSLRRI